MTGTALTVETVEAVALAVLREHYKSSSSAWGHGWPGQDRTGFWMCGCGARGEVNQGETPTYLHRQHVARVFAVGVLGGAA